MHTCVVCVASGVWLMAVMLWQLFCHSFCFKPEWACHDALSVTQCACHLPILFLLLLYKLYIAFLN